VSKVRAREFNFQGRDSQIAFSVLILCVKSLKTLENARISRAWVTRF